MVQADCIRGMVETELELVEKVVCVFGIWVMKHHSSVGIPGEGER